jgi:hypothetical protein
MRTSQSYYEGCSVKRKFVAYFYFVGWDCFSLGMHLCVSLPNIEIHLPFGFIRIGYVLTIIESRSAYSPLKAIIFGITE